MSKGRVNRKGKNNFMLSFAVMLVFLMLTVQFIIPGNVVSKEATNDPLGLVGGDFIISYDDTFNASHPDIAITPTNQFTKENGIAGNIHVVWDEFCEETGVKEIFYSMSKDNGATWTGETKDIFISDPRPIKAPLEDAVEPSIAIDSYGGIHVVWAQQYPDATWEIHYSRSLDNGKTWSSVVTGDVRISCQTSSFYAHQISAPKIVAGVIPGVYDSKTPSILHVVWSEFDMGRHLQEVFYSSSNDQGGYWSGIEQNQMISLPSATEDGYASNPEISTSGGAANFVHVSWIQKGKTNSFDEIYYLRSDDEGKTWNPESEKSISLDIPDGMGASGISMSTYLDDIHIVWSQTPVEKASTGGIFYLGSPDNGGSWADGKQEEIPIDNDDGNVPMNPTIAVTATGEAYAFWSELNDKSIEVHKSYSQRPLVEPIWTGQEKDEIISAPDPDFLADVSNVSVALNELTDGSWRPQVVWEEPNNEEKLLQGAIGDSIKASQQNDEIHYDPPGEPPQYTITATAGTGGSISPSGSVVVQQGDDQSFNIAPSTGYHITDVYVDGAPQGAITSYTFYSVNANHTIAAYFAINTYTLTINIYGSGSVSKNPNQGTYTYGQVVTLTANPASGWSFDQWTGALSGSTNPNSVTMNANKIVNTYFTQNVHYVNLTAGWNLVSLPLIQDDTAVASVLSSISGNYDSVKYYSNQAGRWSSYRPGSSTNDLSNIDHTMAVWIHATSACTLTIHGNIPTYTNITLYAGWNFVGYPTQDTTKTVSTALVGVTYDAVEGYQTSSPYIKDLLGTDPMLPGEGYWIKVPANTVWTINW
ncbi:MAG: hypothetical protein KKH41_06775 [Candidatus Thermoplasmatota archaeon]|nr:exo-alpha-sialidase [Euryarchaeota archaeon]MBU4031983.1 hypothetical protein [Candidatus Thermoplasmatota archaeon]MBU4144520.1 hypothetical protein [Candidatus Thermoplasmatota archaeon]MBU4592271.1 hypothetical protein [Candidatus Thermoplasmatota archaeon]